MPATLTWIGTNPNDFGLATSWLTSDPNHTTPQQGDDLIFRAADEPPLGEGEEDIPGHGGGATGSIEDCIIPSGMAFNSIQLIDDYTGTVTVQDEQTVGDLVLETGAIAQLGSSGSGYDLYVTDTFTFTGGVLNNTANLGIVHLQGATGTLDAGTNGVTTGSTLSLVTGAVFTLLPGAVTANNGAGLLVAGESELLIPEGEGAVEWLSGNEMPGELELFNDGKTTTFGVDVTWNGGASVYKSATLELRKNANITGRALTIGDDSQPNAATKSGSLVIKGSNAAGSLNTVTVEHGLKVEVGAVRITEGDAKVVGDVHFVDGLLTMDVWGMNIDKFPNLAVTGDLILGADFKWDVKVDWSFDTNKSSKIAVTGKTTIVAGAKITPNAPAQGDAKTIVKWDILTSLGKFADDTKPTLPNKWTSSDLGVNKMVLSIDYTV